MGTPRVTRVEAAAVRIVGPSVLVRVWAGDQHGIGECYPSGPAAAIQAIVAGLEEQMLGEDPRNVRRLAEKMRRWHLFTGAQGGAVTTAISGLEMALWDLAGKLQGVPVYRLLGGGFRDRIQLYADCNAGTVDAAGHHTLSDPGGPAVAGLLAAAKTACERGFCTLKFDLDDVYGKDARDEWNRTLSGRQIDRMLSKVEAVRAAVGPEVELAVDLHARYDVPSATRACAALDELRLLWIEEPVPPENLEATRVIQSVTRTPIAAGENLYTRFAFKSLLDLGAVGVVTPDPAKCGGLAEAQQVADMAELGYVAFAPHNVSGPVGTIAAAHLCASVSNFTVLEFHALDIPYWTSLVRREAGPLIGPDGCIALGDAPGLGIELDEEVAFAHRHRMGGTTFFGDPGR